jgi:hypothetical protein
VSFIADDLAAWLVGLVADAGRKRLIELVLGSDQERELERTATVAVQLTTTELWPSDEEHAGQAAIVVSQVFGGVDPAVPTAGQMTLLEALQVGVASQLAVLDDASLTRTAQSSAQILGILPGILADKLTSNLLRQIAVRESRGGPLAPLADQLNHDRTLLQGKRIEIKVDHLDDKLTRLAENAGVSKRADDETEPTTVILPRFRVSQAAAKDLGVHPAIRVAGSRR